MITNSHCNFLSTLTPSYTGAPFYTCRLRSFVENCNISKEFCPLKAVSSLKFFYSLLSVNPSCFFSKGTAPAVQQERSVSFMFKKTFTIVGKLAKNHGVEIVAGKLARSDSLVEYHLIF